MTDQYTYPNGTLRNRLGIIDQAALSRLEDDIVGARQAMLDRDQIPSPYDFSVLCEIHRFLFGDIYDWAGSPRSVPLAKAEHIGIRSPIINFAHPEQITRKAQEIFGNLYSVRRLSKFST